MLPTIKASIVILTLRFKRDMIQKVSFSIYEKFSFEFYYLEK